jgi:hypothetical protein
VSITDRCRMLEFLGESLAERGQSYRELVRVIDRRRGVPPQPGGGRAILDRMIDDGYLCFQYPWTDDEIQLETVLLRWLTQTTIPPEMQDFVMTLRHLVDLAAELPSSADPEARVTEMRHLLECLIQHAEAAASVPKARRRAARPADLTLHHDVFLQPRSAGACPLVIGDRDSVRPVSESVRSIARLSRLLDLRVDFRRSLGILMRKEFGATATPVLQVFARSLNLWKTYAGLRFAAFNTGKRPLVFNPYNAWWGEPIGEYRRQARGALSDSLKPAPDGDSLLLNPEDVDKIADRCLLKDETEMDECGIHIQPVDENGKQWVLNSLYEGTGRGFSRFLPLLPDEASHPLTESLRQKTAFDTRTGRVVLLDCYSTHNGTIDLHYPQTMKCLVMPGARLSIPEAEATAPDALLMVVNENGLPEIRSRSGEKIVPVRLGMSSEAHASVFVKFLCAFGPADIVPILPDFPEKLESGVTRYRRILMENIVLCREAWNVPAGMLSFVTDNEPKLEILRRLQSFLEKNNVPGRVFIRERRERTGGHAHVKRQFIDWSSPTFLEIAAEIIAKAPMSDIYLQEMLPDLGGLHHGSRELAFTLEFMIESVLFNRPG